MPRARCLLTGATLALSLAAVPAAAGSDDVAAPVFEIVSTVSPSSSSAESASERRRAARWIARGARVRAAGRDGDRIRIAPYRRFAVGTQRVQRVFLYYWPRPVETTRVGRVYKLRGLARALGWRQRVCFVVREVRAGTRVRPARTVRWARTCMQARKKWGRLPTVQYRARRNGSQLGVSIRMARRTRLDVAKVTLNGRHLLPRQRTGTRTTTAPTGRFYADWSPWNRPIGPNPAIRAESRRWIERLVSAHSALNVNQGSWTPTVFEANASAPRRSVSCANGWRLDDVPIPPGLAPSSDTDGHALIIDVARNREYDFFRLRRNADGSYSAYACAGVFRLFAGSGFWDGRNGPWGARASSAALGGGLVRPSEVRTGEIEHALAIGIPITGSQGPLCPVSTSDGRTTDGIPMGSRLQLDPTFNVNQLEQGDRILARALQRYGAYVVDTSSANAIFVQNTNSPGEENYPASWSNGLPGSVVRALRVLTPSPCPVYDSTATFGQPHR